MDFRHSEAEARFQALGETSEGRPLHVTFTLRSDGKKIRVIFARDMNRKERAIYMDKKLKRDFPSSEAKRRSGNSGRPSDSTDFVDWSKAQRARFPKS